MLHFNFVGHKVAVVGDVMLDRYLSGSVGRLSPEAPVAVLLKESERAVLGGAGNVVANLVALGAEVSLVAVIGEDEPGHTLAALLRADPQVRTEHLINDAMRPTTCKTRVMSGSHQIVRVDIETHEALARPTEDLLIDAVGKAVEWADLVVVSDYAKGLCSDKVIRAAIETAAQAGKPCIVDPKRRDFSIYRGATLIKPNRRELTDATRLPCATDQQAEAAARAAMALTGSAILLTRSEHGMSYVEAGTEPIHLKTAARDVFDVSGAGDTVVALAALGMAAGLSMGETMRLANAAAGIVVSRVGTAVVTARELDQALAAESHRRSQTAGATSSLETAVQKRAEWRKRGLKVGFTNGCYDLLHPGHVYLLQEAAEACDRLIVAINTDASVKRLKGPSRPVQDETSRAYVLGALRAVDLVILFAEDTPFEAISALKPDLLIKGADYREDQVVGADVVRAAGGDVMLVPLIDAQSTTAMIRRATQPGD